MYQYLLDVDGVWIINYLGEREGYLQVGNETYASFEEAIGAIDDTGTIIVLKDIEAQDLANIPSSKNITIYNKQVNIIRRKKKAKSCIYTEIQKKNKKQKIKLTKPKNSDNIIRAKSGNGSRKPK